MTLSFQLSNEAVYFVVVTLKLLHDDGGLHLRTGERSGRRCILSLTHPAEAVALAA